MRLTIRLAGLGILFYCAAYAQQNAPDACPLTTAQVSAALGMPVTAAKPGMSINSGGIRIQDCRYTIKSGNLDFTLMVQTTAYSRNTTAEEHFRPMAGRLTPVPNDPDKACYQTGQGDLDSPNLHYFRKNVGVHLRILGIYFSDWSASAQEAADRAMQKKLLAVPRIP